MCVGVFETVSVSKLKIYWREVKDLLVKVLVTLMYVPKQTRCRY